MTEAIYLVGGARTPMGGLLGDLAEVSAVELGSTAIRATLDKTGVAADAVDEVFDRLAGAHGPGSATLRRQLLTDLFAAATESEQGFLRRHRQLYQRRPVA